MINAPNFSCTKDSKYIKLLDMMGLYGNLVNTRKFKQDSLIFWRKLQQKGPPYYINCKGKGGWSILLKNLLYDLHKFPQLPFIAYLGEGERASSCNALFALSLPIYKFHPKSTLLFHRARVDNKMDTIDEMEISLPESFNILNGIVFKILTLEQLAMLKSGHDVIISGQQVMSKFTHRPISLNKIVKRK